MPGSRCGYKNERKYIMAARKAGDSLGGVIECKTSEIPAGV